MKNNKIVIFATTAVNGGVLLCIRDNDVSNEYAESCLNKFLDEFKNEDGVSNIFHVKEGKYIVYKNTSISDVKIDSDNITTVVDANGDWTFEMPNTFWSENK